MRVSPLRVETSLQAALRLAHVNEQSEMPQHRYDAALADTIETTWQERWKDAGTYHTPNPAGSLTEGPSNGPSDLAERPKLFIMDMFPYPSGTGLHVGHPLGFISTDVYARFKRMTGFNVLHTMGYDAFGLPAEEHARATGEHPRTNTEANIANMARQLARLGLGHDDRRAVSTTDEAFYRWTQWIFNQIFNAWFDNDAGKARPISELEAEFESGARTPADGGNWADMSAGDQRALINSFPPGIRFRSTRQLVSRVGHCSGKRRGHRRGAQ